MDATGCDMNVTQQDARSLAVRYHQFQVAMEGEDYRGQWLWGRMLRETQRRTGVELIRDSLLARIEDHLYRDYIDPTTAMYDAKTGQRLEESY